MSEKNDRRGFLGISFVFVLLGTLLLCLVIGTVLIVIFNGLAWIDAFGSWRRDLAKRAKAAPRNRLSPRPGRKPCLK